MAAEEPQIVQLDEATGRRVQECARSLGVTPAQVLREAVEEYLATHGSNGGNIAPRPRRGLAAIADSLAAAVPAEEWTKLPTDLAKNFEHYRYGYPRED